MFDFGMLLVRDLFCSSLTFLPVSSCTFYESGRCDYPRLCPCRLGGHNRRQNPERFGYVFEAVYGHPACRDRNYGEKSSFSLLEDILVLRAKICRD